MARPKKNNADYFSHDADMRNDPKIRAVRRKFSHAGYAVWNYTLEAITDSDFFEIEWSDLNVEILAGDFDIDVQELNPIIDYCVNINLLQKIDKKDGNVFLTCEKLKNRFTALLNKRERRNLEYRTPENNNHEVSDNQNPQSKVKESKVNESKEIINNFSLSEKTEKENVLEVFFFKGFIKPVDEVGKFYAHYEKTGWKDKNGNVIINRGAAAELWTQEAGSTIKPPPVEFLTLWRQIYNQIGDPRLLEIHNITYSDTQKEIRMYVSIGMREFMDQIKSVLEPLVLSVFKYNVRYWQVNQ